jgi:ribonuclease D
MQRHAISSEQLAQLALRRYEGRIHFIADDREMEWAGRELAGEEVVGFDTETRPSFRKGERYLPSIVQVAAERAVYVIQLKRLQTFETLAALLETKQVLKAGIGMANDFEKLREVFHFEPASVVDLSLIARKHGMKQSSLRHLAGSLLGFRVPKGHQTSNWAIPRLSRSQIIYAATDAWVCRQLYLKFKEMNFLG